MASGSGEAVASAVTLTVFLYTAALIFATSFPSNEITGYHVRPKFGGNCVVAEINNWPDLKLYCSADIHAVEDALRRYRSLPLGTDKRGDRSR